MGTTQVESFQEHDAEENTGAQQRGRNRRA
jgi:hypothetical protein